MLVLNPNWWLYGFETAAPGSRKICISFGNRKVEMYAPELHKVRDPNMLGTND